jgi:hypothetical protein
VDLKLVIGGGMRSVTSELGNVRRRSSTLAQGYLVSLFDAYVVSEGIYLVPVKQFIETSRILTEITFDLT